MLLIFDYDGVIADSFSEAQAAYNRVAREFGLPELTSPDEFRKLYRENFYESVKRLGFSGEDMGKLIRRTKEELDYSGVRVFRGVKEAIEELRKAHTLVIVTSNNSEFVRSHMRQEELPDLPVLGADVDPNKTTKIQGLKEKHPDLTACYIGDTAGDMKEGTRAGAQTVGVTWGFHGRDELAQENPDHLVDTVRELRNLFMQE